MLDLGFVLLLTFLAAGIGLDLLERLGGRPALLVDAVALAVPLGFGVLALATLALGELAVMNRAGLAIVLALSAGSPWLSAGRLRAAWFRGCWACRSP